MIVKCIFKIPLKNQEKKMLSKTLVFAFVFVYISAMLYIIATYYKDPLFLIKTDVISFLTGAKIISQGDIGNLYDLETQLKFQNGIVGISNRSFLLPFRNFPITAIFYIPLLNYSLRDSYAVTLVINIALLIVIHIIFTRSFRNVTKSICLLVVSLFIYPSISNLVSGQYTSTILLIFFLIYISAKKEKHFLTGFLASLLAIKPQYLLFVPFLFVDIKEKVKLIKGLVSGLILFFLLNLAITGSFGVFTDYPGFILSTENQDFGSRSFQLFTIFGLVKQFWPNVGSEVLIAINMLIYFILLSFVFRIKTEKRVDEIFIIGILTTVLFSVHALSHDLMILILPLYIFFLAGTDKTFLYSGIIFIAAGIFSLAPTSLASIVLVILLLLYRLYSLGNSVPVAFFKKYK